MLKHLLVLLVVTAAAGTAHALQGDASGDGRVTSVDALLALRMAVTAIPVDLAADMDGDGFVTSVDASLIILKAVGMEGMPVEGPKERLYRDLERDARGYNANIDKVPRLVRALAGDERIDAQVRVADGSTLLLRIETSGGRITRFQEIRARGEDATLEAYATEGAVRGIMESQEPAGDFQEAVGAGEINYEGKGVGKKVKVALVGAGMRLASLLGL